MEIVDAAAMRALAHPLKWELMDVLLQGGTATSTQCAQLLGQSQATCSAARCPLGDSALYLSLGIWAKYLTGSNAAAGGIFLAQGVPSLLAPVTGHVVDRVRSKTLLLVANTAMGAAVLSLLLIHSRGQLWLMYTVAAFYGASFTLMGPASAGLLKDLLSDRDLAAANAAFTTIGQGLRIISPLAGAGLYAQFGGGSLAILDAGTFLVAIVMLTTVKVVESPVLPADRSPLRDRLLVGIRYVRATPLLAQITTAAVTAMLVLGFYESLTFAVIAALGKPPSFFGVLMSVQGAGSIVGGLAAAWLLRRLGEARTLGVALGAWVVASLIYTMPSVVVDCAALVIFGIAVPLYAVALGTATQRFTPPRLQGRVGATTSMFTSVSQTLSIAIGAALVDVVNYRILLLVIAVGATAAAVPVLLHPAQAPAIPAPLPSQPAGR